MITNARPDRPRVALLWPGGLFSSGANFGVPQLLMIASMLKRQVDAEVDVFDLDMERAFGPFDLSALGRRNYDLIGLSCYSSFDYLKVMEMARMIRAAAPKAWIVTGGYHASARPSDFTRDDSPFDFVIVGDGEIPMAELGDALVRGRRPLNKVLGPRSMPNPSDVMPYDWSLLDRYRSVARSRASQAEIYLSRGCPFDCAFCMERAKRDVSWRALEPEAAVEELHRLDRFVDLTTWTLFIADALFGMKTAWRKEFLEALAANPIRARKTWLLIRVDLIDHDDLKLMARANVSPGFGLESGDPEHLKLIRKAGKLETYLEKMLTVAGWARDLDVPFGANIIVGHPGETEASMRRSAEYMRKLFLDPRGTTGFLSVDPFRLYPGSPIDEEREQWEAKTGFSPQYYPWWEDGDQDFLSEWVHPSHSLSFRRTRELHHELFTPIVNGIRENFSYSGQARDYYLGAIDEQIELMKPKRRLHTSAMWHLWKGLTDGSSADTRRRRLRQDTDLAELAAELRSAAALAIDTTPEIHAALCAVPRERFVATEDIVASCSDRALQLTEDGSSTISAMHAYALAFTELGLSPGDQLVELGSGSGYGAALASHIVGDGGAVWTVEWHSQLAETARANLADVANVTAEQGDAHDVERWRGAKKVSCTFAVSEVPQAWLDALADGGMLVAPVGTDTPQVLKAFTKRGEVIRSREITPVLCVRDRSVAERPHSTSRPGD